VGHHEADRWVAAAALWLGVPLVGTTGPVPPPYEGMRVSVKWACPSKWTPW
jgi:hypothetical protein